MWPSMISYTFFFSLFTNEIISELIPKKDGEPPKSKPEDLYQKKNIDRTIIVRPLPPPYTMPPLFRPPPPIVLALGIPNGLSNGNRNLGFNPYQMVVPLDYLRNFGLPFNNKNNQFNPGIAQESFPGFTNFGSTQIPNNEFGDAKPGHIIDLLDYVKQYNPNYGPTVQSVQYFRPQPDNQVEPLREGEDLYQKPGPPNENSNVQILKSLGYTLPSEITFNHPVSYAKEYLLDAATSESFKNINEESSFKARTPELLTGEEMSEKDEILAEVESKMKETLNKMETITTNFPSQYYVSNGKPITFDSNNNINNSIPKNIYEIISAHKIIPKEVDMTEEVVQAFKNKTKEDETKEKHDEIEDIQDKIENKTDEENLIVSEKRNSTEQDEDSDLRVLELDKQDDQLLLLLPYGNGTSLKKSPKKRSTNDSFNVNIGAGYGVGIDQNTPFLPESTSQVNSTNPLTSILKNEQVIIGKYPGQLPKFDSEMVESQAVPLQKENKLVEPKKGVMDMAEIQKILHNVDDNSEYSKIVQVVKVPAVYEIHLEKLEKPQQNQNQNAPNQYIHHQINNLASARPKTRPKKKIFLKVNGKPDIIYGTKSKDYIKIDDWQRSNQIRKRKLKPVRSITSHKSLLNDPNRINPVQDGGTHSNIHFREKKNTNHMQHNHPQNHQNYYNPEYTPYYPNHQQKHSMYTTLTRKVPFAVRRELSHAGVQLDEDLIYGNKKEKVSNPEEINITIQPGTTMVTVPKLENSKERNFVEEEKVKGCKTEYSRAEIIKPPPEMTVQSSNIENIYFTTLRPTEKGEESSDRLRSRNFRVPERRIGIRPVKYMLYINKIVTEDW